MHALAGSKHAINLMTMRRNTVSDMRDLKEDVTCGLTVFWRSLRHSRRSRKRASWAGIVTGMRGVVKHFWYIINPTRLSIVGLLSMSKIPLRAVFPPPFPLSLPFPVCVCVSAFSAHTHSHVYHSCDRSAGKRAYDTMPAISHVTRRCRVLHNRQIRLCETCL